MSGTKRPFASVIQFALVILLLISLIMMGQQISMKVYQAGLILLVVATFSQIAFGNIPPTANFAQSMRLYAIYIGITVALFIISILLAPFLVQLGR